MSTGRPVDLPRVRRALASLDRIANDNPGMIHRGATSAEQWTAELETIFAEAERKAMTDNETEAQHQQSMRFPAGMLAQIDAYAEAMAQTTGLRMNRAAAVRALVKKGLETVVEPAKPKRKRA